MEKLELLTSIVPEHTELLVLAIKYSYPFTIGKEYVAREKVYFSGLYFYQRLVITIIVANRWRSSGDVFVARRNAGGVILVEFITGLWGGLVHPIDIVLLEQGQ